METKYKYLGLFVAFVVFYVGGKRMSKPKLKYFDPKEFGAWYTFINNDLLIKLDAFREKWGRPVIVSQASGAIGRHAGDSGSQHNIDLLGETRAIDVFPQGMDNLSERRRALEVAKSVGFTGIGIYTDTKPSNLLHVDVRKTDKVALWARVGGEYVSITQVV